VSPTQDPQGSHIKRPSQPLQLQFFPMLELPVLFGLESTKIRFLMPRGVFSSGFPTYPRTAAPRGPPA
jgi:hypothetical protein